MKQVILMFFILISLSNILAQETNTIIDVRDGQKYKIVKVGNQWWMAENLKSTKYYDGTYIPLVTNDTAWSNLTTPGYCWYANDSIIHANLFGALYNWYTVNTGNLCPIGWHVPSNMEWTVLTDYLGGEVTAGGILKETGTVYWSDPNTGATNETGFTALPGGNRSFDGSFFYNGYYGYWWSSTEASEANAINRYILYNTSNVIRFSHFKKYGFSVRCVKDN